MTTYAKFTENNEWEGETWHFYIPIEGNQEALAQLSTELDEIDEEPQRYEVDLTPLPEFEVDVLVKHTDCGYMHYHNKLTGVLTLPAQVFEDLKDLDNDPFYKGEIRKYVQPA